MKNKSWSVVEREFEGINVKLTNKAPNAQTWTAARLKATRLNQSAAEIFNDLMVLPKQKRLAIEKQVLAESFGRGHGAAGDMSHYEFEIVGLPRLATLFLCTPEYLSHMQQTFRVASATSYYLPPVIKNFRNDKMIFNVLDAAFGLYYEMEKAGVPAEDARYILPLYARTKTTFNGDARELCHLQNMSKKEGVPPVCAKIVDQVFKFSGIDDPYLFTDLGHNLEPLSWYPAAQLFNLGIEPLSRILIDIDFRKKILLLDGPGKKMRQLVTHAMVRNAVEQRSEADMALLKGIHFQFLLKLSIASWHQAIRQRTWNHAVQSIYYAAAEAIRLWRQDRYEEFAETIVIPETVIKFGFQEEFKKRHVAMLRLYDYLATGSKNQLLEPEAVGVLPHSLVLYTSVHIDGWNAIHAIGKRTCTKAQWEIRSVAGEMGKTINKILPALGIYCKPQCFTMRYCPEKVSCGNLLKL